MDQLFFCVVSFVLLLTAAKHFICAAILKTFNRETVDMLNTPHTVLEIYIGLQEQKTKPLKRLQIY